MYYYISFLRPPPTHVSPSAKSLSITPQVANDLRTVLFPNAVDLYMSWLPVPATSTLQPTTPRKLTTWTTSSAYKEIPVGLPPGGRAGQAWALVLAAEPASPRIVLSDASGPTAPFGVMSMPITFKTQGVHAKQERIQRVLALGAPGAAVRITEQTSFDLDKKLWDSGIGLSGWMVNTFAGGKSGSDPIVQRMAGLLQRREAITVVELGAGTGVASIVLAALRGKLPTGQDDEDEPVLHSVDTIFTTDLGSAMPLLEENITHNAGLATRGAPKAHVLDWDEEILPGVVRSFQDGQGLDLILMADVTYNTAVFPALVRTLRLLLSGSTPAPAVLLGFKERDMDERTLWPLLAEIGLKLDKVDELPGAGDEPVEIWIGWTAR